MGLIILGSAKAAYETPLIDKQKSSTWKCGILLTRFLLWRNFQKESKNLGIIYSTNSLTFACDSIKVAGIVAKDARRIALLSPRCAIFTYKQIVILANSTIHASNIEDLRLAFAADFRVSKGFWVKDFILKQIENRLRGT